MAPQKDFQEWVNPRDAQYDKGHHDEKYNAALAEVAPTAALKDNKADEINALKRKITEENLQVEAKRVKVAELNAQLFQAKHEYDQSKRNVEQAVAEHSLLCQAVKMNRDFAQAIERNAQALVAAKQELDSAISEAQGPLSTWANELFQMKSGSLIYPSPKGVFLSKRNDAHSDDKEASGMIQRINNPMYLTDRVVDFVTSKFADAKRGMSSTPGESMPLDSKGISTALWLMMDSQFDKVADAPEQVLLAVVLSNRLDEKADQMVKTAIDTPITQLAARGKVALEFMEEYKSERTTPLKTSDTELEKKILATASTGRLFKKIVEYYGHGILVVLPLAEFFNFTRKQRAVSIPKRKLQALIDLVSNQNNAYMMKGLRLLVSLLNNWIDSSSFKFSLIANKVDDAKQFMTEIGELRERLRLPTRPSIPFSREIDIKPVDRWELLASISGWDSAHDTALVVFKDDPDNLMTVKSPRIILGDILGQRYAYRKNNFIVDHPTDMGVETMVFLTRLLRNTGNKSGSGVFILDCRGQKRVNMQEKAMSTDSAGTCCAVRLEQAWVVVWLLKTEAGHQSGNKAIVFGHEDESGSSTDLAEEAVSRLELNETVKFVHINIPGPQGNASGIHTLCHILALDNLGSPWFNELSDSNIMDIRHALLRATSMAFMRAASARDGQGEHSDGKDSQGNSSQGEEVEDDDS